MPHRSMRSLTYIQRRPLVFTKAKSCFWAVWDHKTRQAFAQSLERYWWLFAAFNNMNTIARMQSCLYDHLGYCFGTHTDISHPMKAQLDSYLLSLDSHLLWLSPAEPWLLPENWFILVCSALTFTCWTFTCWKFICITFIVFYHLLLIIQLCFCLLLRNCIPALMIHATNHSKLQITVVPAETYFYPLHLYSDLRNLDSHPLNFDLYLLSNDAYP